MDTHLSLLSHISYLPSYKPKARTTDIMLEGEADWIVLIQDAWKQSKNKCAKKAWSIQIFDKSAGKTVKVKEKESAPKVHWTMWTFEW